MFPASQHLSWASILCMQRPVNTAGLNQMMCFLAGCDELCAVLGCMGENDLLMLALFSVQRLG